MVDREKLRYIFLEAEIIPWFHLPRFRVPSRSRWRYVFLNQLSAYVDAGIDLPRAIEASIKDIPNFRMRTALEKVKAALEEGQSLSEALREHAPRMFPKTFRAALEIGEKTGTLGNILKMFEGYYESFRNLRRRNIGSLIYPFMVFIVAVTMVFFMLIRIVPTFAEIYADLGTCLPAPTQVLVNLSEFIRSHIPLLATVFGCILFALISLISLSRRNVFFGAIFLRIPFFGPLRYHANLFSFSTMMSILLDSGMATHEALSMCEGDATLPIFRRNIERMRRLVSEGRLLSEAVVGQKLFSPTFLWLISVGEQRGDLAASMRTLSEYEMTRIEQMSERFQRIFEPVTVIAMSLAIGFVVVAAGFPILGSGYLPL